MTDTSNSATMSADLLHEIRTRLTSFEFKREVQGWLRGGVCPQCGKRELYTRADAPWVLRCGRLNKCGWEGHAKDLWPDIFSEWSARARKQAAASNAPTKPNAAADLYLREGRGFALDKIKGWYTQESFYDAGIEAGTATVRFPFLNGYWERLIDRPERFKGKALMKPGMSYAGEWWCPPGLKLETVAELWLVEGIFDAIALMHHGIHAVALMSCNNYPEKALASLFAMLAQCGKNDVKLVWALDSDNAGKQYLQRWFKRARDEGWTCAAAQIPQRGGNKSDWNDMHLMNRLDPEHVKDYLYHGALLVASNATEKGILMYANSPLGKEFNFDFGNCLWWFSLDLEHFERVKDKLRDQQPDATDETIRDQALRQCNPVRRIAQCKPTALYFQRNAITGESWYYYQIEFPHDAPLIKDTFTSSQLNAAGEFKKRLLHIAPGAVYKGTNAMLDQMIERQLYNIKRVDTIDFIGYSKDFGAYIFGDIAVKNGTLVEINKEDFYSLPGGQLVKSLNQSVTLNISHDLKIHNKRWPKLLWDAFGARGYVALAFWLGALFAEQIRAAQKSFPFLEVVGEAGAGKTTLIEFLWKLTGRRDYEGFDPSKSSLAARARNFAQVANLPVVLIESDRENISDKTPHVKSFDWDELKTAYNGRSVRARGVATGGNETYEPPFRGAIVISQNNPVMASDAIMQRICHLYFERAAQSPHTRAAAIALESLPIEEVSNFILRAVMDDARVMSIMKERTPIYEQEIKSQGLVKIPRLEKNHAQLMALTEALAPLINMNEQQLQQVHDLILQMAAERQNAINSDSEIVQQFWDTYDFINRPNVPNYDLNHSNTPDETIAINLNHFYQVARDRGQPMPDMVLLKKTLKTSRRYKFIDYRAVKSNLCDPPRTMRCYVFQKGRGA